MFLLHRSLAIAFIIFLGINYLTVWKELNSPPESDAFYIWWGLANSSFILRNLFESAIFCLVVLLMLPMTKKQMQRAEDFKKFLFGGFLDADQLEKAVIAQNPELSDFHKDLIREEVQELKTKLRSDNTQAIVGGMVEVTEVVDIEDTAYWGYVKIRMQKA